MINSLKITRKKVDFYVPLTQRKCVYYFIERIRIMNKEKFESFKKKVVYDNELKYRTNAIKEAHAGLAEMYINDERFTYSIL